MKFDILMRLVLVNFPSFLLVDQFILSIRVECSIFVDKFVSSEVGVGCSVGGGGGGGGVGGGEEEGEGKAA